MTSMVAASWSSLTSPRILAATFFADTPWKIYRIDPSTLGGNGLVKKVTRDGHSETGVFYTVPKEYRTKVPFPKWVVSELTYRDTITGASRAEEIT
jgi:hypothetical protein